MTLIATLESAATRVRLARDLAELFTDFSEVSQDGWSVSPDLVKTTKHILENERTGEWGPRMTEEDYEAVLRLNKGTENRLYRLATCHDMVIFDQGFLDKVSEELHILERRLCELVSVWSNGSETRKMGNRL